MSQGQEFFLLWSCSDEKWRNNLLYQLASDAQQQRPFPGKSVKCVLVRAPCVCLCVCAFILKNVTSIFLEGSSGSLSASRLPGGHRVATVDRLP